MKHTEEPQEKIVIDIYEKEFMLYYSNTLLPEEVAAILYSALEYLDLENSGNSGVLQ
jgi:hypothetical protein